MTTEHQESLVEGGNCRRHRSHRPPRTKKRLWDRLRNLDDPWLGEAILLGMKVWTEKELAQHAKVTAEQVRAWIEAGLPTLPTTDGAVRVSEAAFDDWAKRQGSQHAKGGRRNETAEIAEFISELKHQGESWKSILKACRNRWPDDSRVCSVEQLRGTYRRHASRMRIESD